MFGYHYPLLLVNFRLSHRIFDGFTNSLKNDERIEIRGFGAFSVRKYKSYLGRNPKTAMCVEVQPKKLPFFKVGKELKRMVDRA
jgi:integration host factor subunit beta